MFYKERYIVDEKKIEAVHGSYELIGLEFDDQPVRVVMSIPCRDVPDSEEPMYFHVFGECCRVFTFDCENENGILMNGNGIDSSFDSYMSDKLQNTGYELIAIPSYCMDAEPDDFDDVFAFILEKKNGASQKDLDLSGLEEHGFQTADYLIDSDQYLLAFKPVHFDSKQSAGAKWMSEMTKVFDWADNMPILRK